MLLQHIRRSRGFCQSERRTDGAQATVCKVNRYMTLLPLRCVVCVQNSFQGQLIAPALVAQAKEQSLTL